MTIMPETKVSYGFVYMHTYMENHILATTTGAEWAIDG